MTNQQEMTLNNPFCQNDCFDIKNFPIEDKDVQTYSAKIMVRTLFFFLFGGSLSSVSLDMTFQTAVTVAVL